MNLKNLIKVTGIRMPFALSLSTILIATISSCQKENVSPNDADSLQTTIPMTSMSRATTTLTYTTSAPISLNGAKNLTITGKSITGGKVPCITLTNCTNIHITHCRLVNSTTVGVNLSKCVNIWVDTSYISNVTSGVYATSCQTVKVIGNQMKNMVGPMPRGQFVQFNTCSGAGNSVLNNKCENIAGSSNSEDAISMYMTNGTAASPVIISGNWIRGGGPSGSSGGIMLGDNGGSYQIAENNVLVNTGEYGVSISSGTNMQILKNQIFAVKNTFTNIGICVWNQYKSGCSATIVSGNSVHWTNSAGVLNGGWNGANCGTVSGWSSNSWGAAITASILPATIITLN